MKYIFLLLLFSPIYCQAFSTDIQLADKQQEIRAANIFKEVRCLVCTGQSIADSNADLARDLRNLIREKIKAGAGDKQIKEYIISRYGSQVLLKPPFKISTLFLWALPFIFLGSGIYIIFSRGARNS